MPRLPPLPRPALPRFVEIIRVSSAGQAERDTPQDQRNALDRLREMRPGVLVERIELTVSGAADMKARGDMIRLAVLASARAFDEVRVRHLDRLTRHENPAERFAVFSLVQSAGAVIVDASGAVLEPDTVGGEVLFYVQTLASTEERRKILARTQAGKDRNLGEGRLVEGRAPYGRTWDKKKGWGIDPAIAATYRRLFDLCLSGLTLGGIVERMNRDGSTTETGKAWEKANVSRLLRKTAAYGLYQAHGRAIQIPPIVDEKTWRAAQERLQSNATRSGPRHTIAALLRKLVTCGECGSSLHIVRGSRGTRYYYACASKGPCIRYHRVELVDAAVRERVAEFLRAPDALRATIERGAAADTAKDEIASLRAELRRLDRQEENLARLLRRSLVTVKIGEKQLAEVQALRAAADRSLAGARAQLQAAARHEELAADMEARIAAMRAGIERASPEDWRALVETLFPRGPTTGVRIHPDGQIKLLGIVRLEGLAAAASEPSPSSGTESRFEGRFSLVASGK